MEHEQSSSVGMTWVKAVPQRPRRYSDSEGRNIFRPPAIQARYLSNLTIQMTTSMQQNPSTAPGERELRLERIRRLVADLEQELANAPTDTPQIAGLRQEIDALKHVLATPGDSEPVARERLHTLRATLEEVGAKVEGEVLRDSPYIAEIGRILGMV